MDFGKHRDFCFIKYIFDIIHNITWLIPPSPDKKKDSMCGLKSALSLTRNKAIFWLNYLIVFEFRNDELRFLIKLFINVEDTRNRTGDHVYYANYT